MGRLKFGLNYVASFSVQCLALVLSYQQILWVLMRQTVAVAAIMNAFTVFEHPGMVMLNLLFSLGVVFISYLHSSDLLMYPSLHSQNSTWSHPF